MGERVITSRRTYNNGRGVVYTFGNRRSGRGGSGGSGGSGG